MSFSTKVFVKSSEKQAQNSENSQNSSAIKKGSKLAFSTRTFKPKKYQEASENEAKVENGLVLQKFNSSRNLSSFQLSSTKMANNDDCVSEASTNSGASFERDNSSPQPSTFNQKGNDSDLNTFSERPQMEMNGEATLEAEGAKPKKKTRRGGRKARLRREKEKAKAAQNTVPTVKTTNQDGAMKNQIKYKTELCKNWIETGKCSYSVRCMFAHGHHELSIAQPRPLEVPTAKKQPCGKFHNELYCSYGSRCLYSHEERSTKESSNSYFAKNLLSLKERMTKTFVNQRRLRVFEEITGDFDSVHDAKEDYSVDSCTKNQTSMGSPAPIDECYSTASDSTDLEAEEVDDLANILAEVF